MSLAEKIASDLINAMKAKDKVALEAIRAAKTAFILAKAEKGATSVLSPEDELKIIQKLVKQRKESAAIYIFPVSATARLSMGTGTSGCEITGILSRRGSQM